MRALRTPCATIAKNAGVDPSVVVQRVMTGDSPSMGYDALHDRYVDMIQEGECTVLFRECSCIFYGSWEFFGPFVPTVLSALAYFIPPYSSYLSILLLFSLSPSLGPRPLPDFISQLWRKSGEGLGAKLHHGPEMVDSVSTNRVHVTY